MLRSAALGLVGLTLALVGAARAEETPPAGTWKVMLPLKEGRMEAVVLLKLAKAEGKWTGEIVSAAEGLPPASVDNVQVNDGVLRCNLKLGASVLRLAYPLPKEKAAKLTGSILLRGNASPTELEPTTLTSLDEYEVSKELLAKQSAGYEVVRSALTLLTRAATKKAKPEEVRSWAAKAVKAAEPYGAWSREIVVAVAEILGKQKGYEAIALTYARQAERQLDDSDMANRRKHVLEMLASLLEKSGKADEAKEVAARVEKIDFAIKPTPFAGRKGKSNRVVLVELFTGAQCDPCVAANLAFDALGKAYKPGEVVHLQYHLHIPGPDPLANAASEARAAYYGDAIEGTPTVLFNGRTDPGIPGGGSREDGPERYQEYVAALTPLLETKALAQVKATAKRDGAKIAVNVEANAPEDAGNKLRLRLVLVEEQVNYTGGNKLSEHHHVVRGFPGGVEGEKLTPGKPFSKTVNVDLDQVRRDLKDYLKKSAEDKAFPNKERPLDLKNLRIVAFVQNDATREVLQATQVDVAE